ncbi:MAG: hypothetical protein WCH05_02285 [Chlorobiaceae bacterium]
MGREIDLNKQKTTLLRFSVEFDGKPEGPISLAIYAFDRGGRLLAVAPVNDGGAELSVLSTQARTAHIFIASQGEEAGEAEATLELMNRLYAYEPVWAFDPKTQVYKLLPIPADLWKWWLRCRCRVRGQVVKPVIIGGVSVQQPVCDARVHICEVDPWFIWIRKLPDLHLLRLRDELLEIIANPDVVFPDPAPDPLPFGRSISTGLLRRAGELVELNPQPEPPIYRSMTELPMESRLALTSSSLSIVREALLASRQLILPRLCHFPWLMPFLSCDELRVVQTDSNGRFDITILYRCFGDKPDLYFWVEFFIDGVWQTVYHPNMRCATWWNYPCGSQVTISLTDPRVTPCHPITSLPGRDVVLVGIGAGVSVGEIKGELPVLREEGLTTSGQPFASTLELRMDMGWETLGALGITHYRWFFRRVTEGDGTTPVSDVRHLMLREVFRHYKIYVPDPVAGWRPDYPAELMGPDASAPGGEGWIKLLYAGKEWSVRNEHVDMAYAYFESASLPAGKYELTMELGRLSGGSVSIVDWSALSVLPFVAAGPAPFLGMGTVPASDDYLVKDTFGHIVGMRLVVHVDNTRCLGDIREVHVGSESAGPCGFIHYIDKTLSSADISFTAYHPYQFATFDFSVAKGSSGVIDAVSFDDAPVGVAGKGYSNDPSSGLYARTVPVSLLLDANGHICTSAAFAENLSVYSTATDGYQRAVWLDWYAVPKAFALAPLS